MTRTQIEARMGTLRDELTKANEELGKLRPRVQFLEQIMLRVDGALTVLQELLDGPDEAPPPLPPETLVSAAAASPHARSDAEFAPSWQTVAP